MTDAADRPGAIRRALISVSDKSGLEPLARALAAAGAELVSTGGTAAALRGLGLEIKDVSEITGFPEMMDGRVKTLHPMVHGGLLADRSNPGHVEAMTTHGVGAIDLLVVNLYPFEATVASGAGVETCIENIDIGGPAMIRAASKNHAHVAVLTDPADYAEAIREIEAGGFSQGFKRRMAAKAFARTAAYDAAIAARLEREGGERFPARLSLAGERRQLLRYGENPHQQAAFYATAEARPGVATATLLQGKELSYNNLNDTDAAYELAADLGRIEKPGVAIIKHANPCGVATADTLEEAYEKALACDPVSAFGGVIAVNRPLDAATATRILEIFTEVVIAPGVAPEAAQLFAAKPNLRLLDAGALPDAAAPGLAIKTLAGGFLAQDRDASMVSVDQFRVVTKRAPSPAEREDLMFAWIVAKHVKSNAIVLAKGGCTVGVGAGQMSRVDSTRIAAQKAADSAAATGLPETRAKNCVAASDAFFPFPDGLLAAADAGATAVIQPGGSVKDSDVIEAADARGLAMVFTGQRHFRH